jgi:hypothetical protein
MGSKCSKPGKGLNSNSSQKLMHEKESNENLKEKQELKNADQMNAPQMDPPVENKKDESHPPLANEKNEIVELKKYHSLGEGIFFKF